MMPSDPLEQAALEEIAARMRRYAFAHPLNPLAALDNPRAVEPYQELFLLDGFMLGAIFSVIQMSSGSMAQLSLSDRPAGRPLPAELVDRVRDAFFDPADVLRCMSARERNAAALLLGKEPIASDNTEVFLCRNPRRPKE